jgi:hypothetical protein
VETKLIFSVGKSLNEVEEIKSASFNSLDIWERTHIQEWVRKHPLLLGEDLLIVSMEFDRFVNSSDRLDLLALDRDGNLVVVELKRDPVAGYADLQALRYAAMVSSMTIEKLLPYYLAYQKNHCSREISPLDARTELIKFVDSEGFIELSSKPRIILCSEGFSQEITTTVLWLRASEIDIRCVQITPYQHDHKIIIVPKVLIPLDEAKQYLIDIKVKEEEREQSSTGIRRRTMQVIQENSLMNEGDLIFLKNALPSWLEFKDGDPLFEATMTGKFGRSNAVRWHKDGEEYSISGLTWKIFSDSNPEGKPYGGVNGSWHWVDSKGQSLWQIAEDFLAQG